MALDPVRNHAIVTVTTRYDADDTTIVLATGHGAKLPDPATEGAFNLVWWNDTDYKNPSLDPNVEIVRVTGKTGDTLTVVRPSSGNSYNNEGTNNVAATHNTIGRQYKMAMTPSRAFVLNLDSEVRNRMNFIITVGGEDTYADYKTSDYASDELAIKAAMQEANANGGGTVFIMSGTYIINGSILPYNNVIVLGNGQSTILQNEQAANGIFRHTDDVGGLANFALRDIKLICNEGGGACWYSRGGLNNVNFRDCSFISPGTGINGFIVFFDEFNDNEYIDVDHCHIEGLSGGSDMIGSGMGYSIIQACTFANGDGQGTANTGARYCQYINNYFYKVGNPISLEGAHYHNTIEGNYVYYSGYIKSALPSGASDTAFYTKIINNICDYSKNGVQIGQGTGCLISGNLFYRTQNDSIFCSMTDGTISNNKMYQCNWGNSFRTFNGVTCNKGGIHLVNSAYIASQSHNNIIGNTIYGDNVSWVHPETGATVADKTGGIGLDTDCIDTSVKDNDVKTFFGVGTKEIVDQGTDTSIFNNKGIDPMKIYNQGNITGATTFKRLNGNVITATLTGNVTTTMQAAISPGTELTLILTQDATGGRTMTTPSNMKPANGGTLTLSKAPNAVDVISFIWDQVNAVWREKSRAMAIKSPRVIVMADATSFTPTGDTADLNKQANTQSVGTLTANAPSGTPVAGQIIELQIKCTNIQTWAWDAIYRGSNDVALPTATTGSSKTDKFLFQYNADDTKWDLMAKSLGY